MRLRERRAKWANEPFEKLSVFRYPFSQHILSTIIFLWLLISLILVVIASGIVVAAVPLGYVTTFIFLQYSFVVVEYTARGHQQVPRISGHLFLPTTDSRLGSVFVLTMTFLSIILLVGDAIPFAGFFLATVLFPVALAVLIIEHSLFSALNPVRWGATLASIAWDKQVFAFLLIQVTLLMTLFLTFYFFEPVTSISLSGWVIHEIFIFITLCVAMVYFRLLGSILHANSEALGMPVLMSEEIQAAEEQAAVDKERSDFIIEVYQLANAGRQREAWEKLDGRMKAEHYRFEADYFSRISKWDRHKLVTRAAGEYLERLAQRKEVLTALNVFDIGVASNATFVPKSADTLMFLAEHADSLARKQEVARALASFPDNYPGHPGAVEALLQAVRLHAMSLNDFDEAKRILDHLESSYPHARQHPKFEPLKAIVSP